MPRSSPLPSPPTLPHLDALLCQALVFKDLEAVKYYCMKLNSGDMYSLLAAVLTNRSWDDIKDPSLGSLRTPNTKQDRTLIRTCESFSLTGCRREHLSNPEGRRLMWVVIMWFACYHGADAQKYLFEITEILNRVPRQVS